MQWGCNLRRVLLLHILNSATALDTTDCEARRVRETADDSSLPLKGALQCLVEFRGVFEVDDVDVPVGRADDEQVLLHVHGVDTLLACQSGRRALLPEIPVLDRLVPRAGDHHGAAAAVEEAHAPYGLVVCSDDNVLLGRQVADLDVLVCTGGGYLCSILFWSTLLVFRNLTGSYMLSRFLSICCLISSLLPLCFRRHNVPLLTFEKSHPKTGWLCSNA